MSVVRLEHVAKQFGNTAVVVDVSLEIRDGELLALLGPSGSGKTTLLRLIAGFEQPDAGRVFIDSDDVTMRSPLERRCGMVFQHYALFPHLTVAENVAYGLAGERNRDARSARVIETLQLVDLAGYGDRPVTALSGGQQQRVALARALAPRPKVLLLDEPLSNLDPSLRERTRAELRALVNRIGITTVLVTHEQEEAFDLADRIALLHLGRLEQLDTPDALYRVPTTPFVAGFVGRVSPLSGRVTVDGGVDAAGNRWPVDTGLPAGSAVTLLVRPEALRVDRTGSLHGTVVRHRFAGAVTFFTVALANGDEVEVAGSLHDADDRAVVTLSPTGHGLHAWAVT